MDSHIMAGVKGKQPSWKGHSRISKSCHWCTKEQVPGQPAFPACASCKEVIYCSKECQKASWPLHKGHCKTSAAARKRSVENPDMMQGVATLKKWHQSHVVLLRHAAVCGLDLAKTPSNAESKALMLEVALKPDHAKIPADQKYHVVDGFNMTQAEFHQILRANGGEALIESGLAAHKHMKAKGSLGITTMLIKAGDVVDAVRIALPSHTGVNDMIRSNGDWGTNWVVALQTALLANPVN